MAFTRKNVAAVVAGTVSLAMLAGCGPQPTAPVATPTPATSAAPTAPATTAAPSTAPVASTPAASGTASVAPTTPPSAKPPSGKTVIVSGTVYNEKGATVDQGTVTVKSLDTNVPYEATVPVVQGSYVVNDVPEGANVQITATKDGWTSRKRVGSFQQAATGKKNIQNFGNPSTTNANADDPDGGAYFISDYPEIVSTSPADEDLGVDNTKTSFKLTFSEALDQDSRDAVESAFHIIPANTTAQTGASDISDLGDSGANYASADAVATDIATGARYSLGETDSFLGSSKNKLTASWDSKNMEVTFSFDGNLKTGENTAAKYNALLISGGSSDKIEDAKGNQLGTDSAGDLNTYAAIGSPVYNAFKDKDLAVETGAAVDTRWEQTHKHAIMFEVKKDTVHPKLAGIAVVKDNADLRIELTFSEPMAAYAGSGKGSFGAGLGQGAAIAEDLANFTFMVGEDRGDLTGKELDGAGTAADDIEASNANGLTTLTMAEDIPSEEEFEFTAVNSALATSESTFDASAAISIALEVEPDDPRVLNLWLKGKANLFEVQGTAARRREIKARVVNAADPAGNAISADDADKNLVTGSI